MNKLITRLAAVFLVSVGFAAAQTSLTQSSLVNAITPGQTMFQVASTSGFVAGSTLAYVDNEAMTVNSIPLAGTPGYIGVTRGASGTKAFAHKAGTMILVGAPAAFIDFDPNGSCTNGAGLFVYSPIINEVNGNQWLCSSVTGKVVPGFANQSDAPQVTTAVASAAGKITPSGPLFHISGTAAITGFNIPVGLDPTAGATVCAIPDGTFTTTSANNIAIGSTAVVSKVMCWSYDGNSTKFYPSY